MTADERIALIRVKIERANEHIVNLERAIRAFLDSKPYRIETKRNPQKPKLGYSYILSAMEPTSPVIAAIAGDAIHNLRSVLDHLAVNLFLVGPNRPTGPGKYDSFVIADDAKEFEARLNGVIQSLRPDAADALRRIEPYKGGKGHPLWVLHKLDIIDKHRLLMTVVSTVTDKRVVHKDTLNVPPSPIPGLSDRHFPLKAGDELLRVYGQFAKHMQFTFEVALDEPGIVECQPLLETVKQLDDFVSGTFNILEPRLR